MAEVNINKIITSKVVSRFLHYYRGIRNIKDFNSHHYWNGYINNKGYGAFKINGLVYLAHRISYLYHNNMIQSELQVLHKNSCHVRNCINPTHLYLGTEQNNVDDSIQLGTFTLFNYKNDNHYGAKGSNEIILKIRFEYEAFNFTQQYLANKYNLSQQQISRIINRKRRNNI